MNTWKFTDLEFDLLWTDLGEVCLPRPLCFTSRIAKLSEFERERNHARESLRQRLDPAFDEVLTALYRPDIRIEVLGWDGADYTRVAGNVRILATRRAGRGFLVTQLPGETVYHSRGFVVTECPAVELGSMVAQALPQAEPGRRADIPLPAALAPGRNLDYGYRLSKVRDSFEVSAADRAAHFLSEPTTAVGTIDIIQARSVFGPRGTTRYRLRWRDAADDGRYLIDDRDPPVAAGADQRRLSAEINVRIARIVHAIKDERVSLDSAGG